MMVGSDGTKAEWGQLPVGEQEWMEEAFCRRIGKNLSVYYSAHQAEWERLATEFSKEDRKSTRLNSSHE